VRNIARADWAAPTSWDEVCRRAAGRNHHNSMRRFRADWRRLEVLDWLRRLGTRRGAQAQIPAQLGVSPATIARDVARLLHQPPWPRHCPVCGRSR
jgi:hypothetical protein